MAFDAAAVERRFVVGIGVSDYDVREMKLVAVPGDVATMTEWFSQKCGVAHVRALDDLADSPTHEEISGKLRGWLQQRENSDVAVIYLASHGELEGEVAYILGRNSPRELLAGAALSGETLGDIIGQAKPHNLLLIIDACVAGKLATEILTRAIKMADALNRRDPYRGAWSMAILSSTFQRDPAHDGRFVEAFLKVVSEENRTGTLRRWIGIDTIAEALNEELRANEVAQVVEQMTWGVGVSKLIPNPHFNKRRWGALMDDAELITHFDPQSRGVAAGEAGWYFTGRQKELEQMVKWLSKSDTNGKPYVVTGSPGSGKSALVSRLITLSDPTRRSRIPDLENVPPKTVPPDNSINAVVWCHNKTAEQVVTDLAGRLGVGARTMDELLSALANETRHLGIVIDSLDEAVEGEAPKIASEVIRPLAAKNERVKVIVATRPHPVHGSEAGTESQDLLTRLGVKPKDSNVLVLDKARNRAIDMRAYVAARLMASAEPDCKTPYTNDPALAERLAMRIADAADTSFLVASVTARSFANQKTAVDPEVEKLPTEAGEALGQYIKRLKDPAVAVDILRPLAWAEGGGLPWGTLWAPIASAMAGEQYDNDTIVQVLERASDLISETVANGEPAYRLFHEALAEYLRRDRKSEEAHTAFADTIGAMLTPTSYENASSYALAHVTSHMARAGNDQRLYDLVADPAWERAKRLRFGDSTRFLRDVDLAIVAATQRSTAPNELLVGSCIIYGRMMAVAPAIVVGVIARAGQLQRAELLANNIEFAIDRAQGYALIAPAFAADGDLAGAQRCLRESGRAISAINAAHAAMAWSWIAQAAVACGFGDVATRASKSATDTVGLLRAQDWEFDNALFWAALAARTAGDEESLGALKELFIEGGRIAGRNQYLQAAAVLGLKEPLRAMWKRAMEAETLDLVRDGNIALALADAGMQDEFKQLTGEVAKRGQPRGEEDAQKRYAWALALAGDFDGAVRHLHTIESQEERARALARVVRTAVDRKHDQTLDEAKRIAKKMMRVTDWRVQSLLADVFFMLGERHEAMRLAEEVVRQGIIPSESNTVAFGQGDGLLDKVKGFWKSLLRTFKSTRTQLPTDIRALEDFNVAADVVRLVHAGKLDDATARLANIRIPRARWTALKPLAEATTDEAKASVLWREALLESRLVNEPSVRETVIAMTAKMTDTKLRKRLLAEVRRINVRWIEASFAEQYESMRSSLRSGPERTHLLEELMVLKKRRMLPGGVPAIDLSWWMPKQVTTLAAFGSEGKRAFALALMEADPRLARFETVLKMIPSSLSAFEQFHSLRVLSKMVSNLTPTQCKRVQRLLAAERKRHIRPGTDRERVAQEIERQIAAAERQRKP